MNVLSSGHLMPKLRFNGPLEPLRVHEEYFIQCLETLFDSAVKAALGGGHVEVHVHSETADDQVRLWFEDRATTVSIDRPIVGRSQPWAGTGLFYVRKMVE